MIEAESRISGKNWGWSKICEVLKGTQTESRGIGVKSMKISFHTRVRFPSTPSKPGSWDVRYDIVIWKNQPGALKEIKITALYIDSDMQCRYFYGIHMKLTQN